MYLEAWQYLSMQPKRYYAKCFEGLGARAPYATWPQTVSMFTLIRAVVAQPQERALCKKSAAKEKRECSAIMIMHVQ